MSPLPSMHAPGSGRARAARENDRSRTTRPVSRCRIAHRPGRWERSATRALASTRSARRRTAQSTNGIVSSSKWPFSFGRRPSVSRFRRQAVACVPEASAIRAVDETLGVSSVSIARRRQLRLSLLPRCDRAGAARCGPRRAGGESSVAAVRCLGSRAGYPRVGGSSPSSGIGKRPLGRIYLLLVVPEAGELLGSTYSAGLPRGFARAIGTRRDWASERTEPRRQARSKRLAQEVGPEHGATRCAVRVRGSPPTDHRTYFANLLSCMHPGRGTV
jgi:hypothetical protein